MDRLDTAFLSILLAVCSSQANGVRTEFIAKMVEEDGTMVRYQTVSTKYCLLQAQLQHIHALMPDPKPYLAAETELKTLEAGKMADETTKVVKALRLHTRKVLESVMPTLDDVQHLAKLIRSYRVELETVKTWVESYTPVTQTLTLTSSRLEKSQLFSEIAIILASLALMVGYRKWLARAMWTAGIALGVISLIIVIVSLVVNQGSIHQDEIKLDHAREAYFKLIKDYSNEKHDDTLLNSIEADLEKMKLDH